MRGRGRTLAIALALVSAFVMLTFGFTDAFASGSDLSTTCDSDNSLVNEQSDPEIQWDPSLAILPDGSAYVAWSEFRGIPSVVVASNRGGAWRLLPTLPDQDRGSHQEIALAASQDGRLFAAWRGGNGTQVDVLVASFEEGLGWSSASIANDVSSPTVVSDQIGPGIAIGPDGTVYVAWEDWRNGNPDIYLATSRDRGRIWSANLRLNDDGGSWSQRGEPVVAVDADGNILVAWSDLRNGGQDPDIYLSSSSDQGGTWSANVRVNDDPPGEWQGDPAVAPDAAGGWHLVWQDNREGRGKIFHSQSVDGRSWTPNTKISGDDHLGARDPALATREDRVYASWYQFPEGGGGGHIGLAASKDRGLSWSAPYVPANRYGFAESGPALAVRSDGRAVVAWTDTTKATGNKDMYASSCLVEALGPVGPSGPGLDVFLWIALPAGAGLVGLGALAIRWSRAAHPRRPT